jgi:hypothetical protein
MPTLSLLVSKLTRSARHAVSLVLALALVVGALLPVARAQTQQQPAVQMLSPEQLDQLVAPIALYPDNLLGQILMAATYPLEVVTAARWVSSNSGYQGAQLESAMQQQPWDPSVKSLAAVPQVIAMMNEKLDWTQQLGDAYLAQPDDVAAAIQRLRARAESTGSLRTTNQQRIVRVAAPPSPIIVGAAPLTEYIAIEPVNPEILYVPVYDPVVVYGAWPYPAYLPFYWSPPGFVSVGVFAFAAPIVVGAALWATYDWRSRRIDVNINRFNTFNKTNLANTLANRNWQHDPIHRGNIGYKNPVLQQKFGNAVTNQNLRNNPGGRQPFNPKSLNSSLNPNAVKSVNTRNGNLNNRTTTVNSNETIKVDSKNRTRTGNSNETIKVDSNNRTTSVNRNANINVNPSATRNSSVNQNAIRGGNVSRAISPNPGPGPGANVNRGGAPKANVNVNAKKQVVH